MSDDADKRAAPGVSLSKKPASGGLFGGSRQLPPDLPRPATIRWATIAVGAQILFAALHAGLSWGFDSELKNLIVVANKNAKQPKKYPCDPATVKNCLDLTKQLHSYRSTITQSTIIVAILIILLTFMFRRGSGPGRWIYIILSVIASQLAFVGSPIYIAALTSDGPFVLNLMATLAGVASVAAIVLLILPKSSTWFRAVKAATHPDAPARPGLAGLFGPRRPVTRPEPKPEPRSAPPPVRAKSKAKVRADAEAVAKGAELARSRAKASKSRKSPE